MSTSLRYQSDPPVTGTVAYLRIHDLDSLQDGDTITSWGTASATSSPIYKNDSIYDFPYVQLNGGYFTLGQKTIQPSLGFTFMGQVLTTSVGPQFPLIYSYAEGQNDGIRVYRTGGSGQDLVFRSQKAASIEARADDATTINTWQVFTSRVTDNGDSTLTMEIFIDNVLQGTTTGASSDMSGIVSGLLEVGQSTAWGGNPVSPIYLTDFYFYDRTLSDTELTEMHTYFSTLGDPYTPPNTTDSGSGDALPVIPTYKGDPPVTDAIASLRVRDLDSLENDDAVITWGTSTASSGPIYKNDSTFPYVDINGGVVDLGNFDIVSSSGFTYTGLVFTTAVNKLYPPIFTYMTSRDDGLRLIRSGSGADLYFYSDGPQRVQAGPYTSSDINTWQVFSVRATNNGDNTVTMDMLIDNVIVATNTVTTSVFCNNTTGHLDVGKSSWYPNDPAAPIYISDTFFYDRALSDPELSEMYTYLSTLGEYIPATDTTVTVDVGVSDMDVVPNVFFANLSWTPRNLARSYRVEYTGTDGSSGTLISSGTSIRVGSLTPNTEYDFVLYSSDGASFRVYGESVTSTTQENLLVNYDATDFENSSGIVDLTSLSTSELDFIGEHMNELFSTGAEVVQSISTGSIDTIFVRRGNTINIADDKKNVFSVPFDESAGSGQQVSISTGTQDIVVSYDETTDKIIVDGTAYSDGESFVVDGKKMKVYNI